jgi:benzoyl-CoA reductase subunit C
MNLINDPFLKIANSIENEYTRDWQDSNKKIIGYYCTYIPEELIHAAGIFPYRVRATGHDTTELGDILMVRFTCSFVRASLDLALRGGFDFFDGFLICNSCDHSRRMYEIFDMKVFNREGFNKKVPRFYISVPHVITEEGFGWFKQEVEELKQEIESAYDVKINDSDLKNSIKVFNENRSLLREIHKLRILDNPKLTGAEALQIAVSNSSVPKEIANQELNRILTKLKASEGIKNHKKRIMVVGSLIDDLNFINLIENSGGLIVSDFLCFGTRDFVDDVEVNGNPLEKITKRSYYRKSCPRMMDDHENRLRYLKKEIDAAKIDGVILQRINNCDLHGCDNMLFEHDLKDLGIPAMNIDREYVQTDLNRLQTRIEAFLEMI